jgi:hypothetical protein
VAKSWQQLCLFCRGEGIVCVEQEGDLGTYVECGMCSWDLSDVKDCKPETPEADIGE